MKVNREHHSAGRKLAAIMLTDTAGYTALMQKDEQTAFTYLRHFQKEMKEKVAGHSSRIVNFYEMKRLAFLNLPRKT